MASWTDFNDAQEQSSGGIIPKYEVVVVRMTIKPGGHDDRRQGWTGGYATASRTTDSVFLAGQFEVLEGRYAGRKVYSNIGLYSPKSNAWAEMGRSFIRAALNSAKGVSATDTSPQARSTRCIQCFRDLDGLEFVVEVDVEPDSKGKDRNIISMVIEPGHASYVWPKKNPEPVRRTAPPRADVEFNDAKPF